MTTTQLKTFWPALHAAILVVALVIIPPCLPLLQWPWYLLLPLAAYVFIALLVPPLRRTAPWPPVGRVDRVRVIATVILSGSTVGVLLAYQWLEHPEVTTLAASIPVAAIGNLFLAGVCFSVGNAVLEELIFRGVLYEALAADWNNIVAVGVTAVCFGLGHLQGYPPGSLGALLAGLYGVALGLLRWWSGGLLLAICCHASADATIFSILASTGAFPEVFG